MSIECQRFFAFSKRVPKDVKRFCGICRQHGKMEETRGHVCEFKDCECPKCILVRSRRLVMSQQIRLRRAQDKRFQRTTEPEEADVFPLMTGGGGTEANTTTVASGPPVPAADSPAEETEEGMGMMPTSDGNFSKLLADAKNMCYFCQKCKNHGILVWKKQHKRQCPFTECTCEFCELIETRRKLDQHIKRRKSEPQRQNNGSSNKNNNSISSSRQSDVDTEAEEAVPRKKSTASLPAQMEAMAPEGNGRGAPVTIPIGIARHATNSPQRQQLTAPSPLDALAAQLSRIQQQSPMQAEDGQQTASNSPTSSLMDQLLVGSAVSASISPPPAPQFLLPAAADQLLGQLLLSSLPPAELSTLASLLPQMTAGSPLVPIEQQTLSPSLLPLAQPTNAASQSALNDALLSHLLLNSLSAGQVPLPALPKLDFTAFGASVPPAATEEEQQPQLSNNNNMDLQREALLQMIGQLLHQEQQQSATLELQQILGQLHSSANNNNTLLPPPAAVDNNAALTALLASQTLLSQQQQNLLLKDQLKAAGLAIESIGNSTSAEQHQQQSAFTALHHGGGRDAFNGGLFS